MKPYKVSLAQWRKRRERIQQMLEDGISKSDIARKLGITRQRVHQLVGCNGRKA